VTEYKGNFGIRSHHHRWFQSCHWLVPIIFFV